MNTVAVHPTIRTSAGILAAQKRRTLPSVGLQVKLKVTAHTTITGRTLYPGAIGILLESYHNSNEFGWLADFGDNCICRIPNHLYHIFVQSVEVQP
jgi:hypothetical protein